MFVSILSIDFSKSVYDKLSQGKIAGRVVLSCLEVASSHLPLSERSNITMYSEQSYH